MGITRARTLLYFLATASVAPLRRQRTRRPSTWGDVMLVRFTRALALGAAASLLLAAIVGPASADTLPPSTSPVASAGSSVVSTPVVSTPVAASPSFALSPDPADLGVAPTISGAGWPPGDVINVFAGTSTANAPVYRLAALTADAAGDIAGTAVEVPPVTGTYVVAACPGCSPKFVAQCLAPPNAVFAAVALACGAWTVQPATPPDSAATGTPIVHVLTSTAVSTSVTASVVATVPTSAPASLAALPVSSPAAPTGLLVTIGVLAVVLLGGLFAGRTVHHRRVAVAAHTTRATRGPDWRIGSVQVRERTLTPPHRINLVVHPTASTMPRVTERPR